MSFQRLVEIDLVLAGLYLAAGLVFTLVFHVAGLRRVDPAVVGAGWFFRLLITPGLIALWPLFVLRWWRAAAGRPVFGEQDRPVSSAGLRRFHRVLAQLLAVLVPIAAGLGLWLRPGAVYGPGPVHAAAPAFERVLVEQPRAFVPLDIALRVRGAADGRAQIELELERDLEIPDLLLYLNPAGAESTGDAELLGPVWGPGISRFPLADGTSTAGLLILYSPALGERLATHGLTIREGR